MGIRAKQMLSSTFDSTEVGRLFAAQAIAGSKIANGEITGTQLASSVAGSGLTGGGGSALAVQPDTTTGGGVPGIAVGANGVGLAAAAAGGGLTGGAGAALAVGAGSAITVNANDVAFDATAADGNGLTGAGAVLTVDPDSETGGNIQPANVTVNGVGVDINAIAGTGVEADGSANLRLATQGNGISGGNGSTLSVNADTGIAVSASGVAVDVGSTVDFSANTPVWTFGNETTAQGLFVSGTPVDANHVTNKTYVDNAITGLTWLPPVHVKEMIGTDAALDIEGFSPAAGDSYVIDTANGAGALVSATIGDIWEYSGSAWTLIIAGVGGFVADGYRALASIQTTLNGTIGLVNNTDDGKVLEWDGTSLTPAKSVPSSGDAVLVTDQDGDGDSAYANNAYTFQGSVPTGTWEQFSGAGQINAGTGLTKDGNTLNVGAGSAISVAADSVSFDATGADGNGLVGSGSSLAVQPDTTTGGGVPGIAVGANGVGLSAAAAGGGLTGGAGAALAVGAGTGITVNANDVAFDATAADGNGLSGTGAVLTVDPDSETGGNIQPANVTVNGVGVDISAIAGTGLEADGSANLRLAAQGTGIAGGAGSTLSFDATAADGNGLTGSGAVLTVQPDTTTGGGEPGLAVGINGVGISAGAAGAGLTGGAGSALAVGAGSGITVNANDVAFDATAADGNGLTGSGSSLAVQQAAGADGEAVIVAAGGLSINGDLISIDETLSNITPDTGGLGTDVKDLASIILGIDNALAATDTAIQTTADKALVPAATSGNGSTTTKTISGTPLGWVGIYLNGILYELGSGVKTKACYFSGDGGTTARAMAAIVATDTLYWNGVVVGFDLDTSDIIDMVYET